MSKKTFFVGCFAAIWGCGDPNLVPEEYNRGMQESGSASSTSSASSGGWIGSNYEEDKGPDPNQCGVDYIVLLGKNGETYIVEIPIPCDPLANIYKGCPAPLSH